MKILSKFKGLTRKIVTTAAVAVVVTAGAMAFNTAHAANLTLNTAKDCDYNAVMYCGAGSVSQVQSNYAHGVAGRNTYYSIQDIYHYFGISSSQISGMSSTAVAGRVTKSGDVYAGNTLVATNAMTAGRMNIPGSTQVKYGATTFYKRAPSVSFRSDSIAAYVVMVNGKFQFAILASCGNPVVATPKTPNYSIEKQVRTTGQSAWSKSVTAVPGQTVQYRIVVTSTGQVPAVNVKVTDTLPANITYKDGLTRDGVAINPSDFFGAKGNVIAKLNPGTSVIYAFNAIVGKEVTVDNCTPATLTNTGHISSPGLPNEGSGANVNEKCLPKPAYSCVSLTASKQSDLNYKFTATTSATNGAKIVSYTYNFGDGSNNQTINSASETSNTSHLYAQLDQSKTYTVTVTAVVSANGTQHQVGGPQCQTTVTIPAKPPVLAAKCTNLDLTQDATNPLAVTAKVTYTTSGGATLSNIAYDFGDTTVVNTKNTTQAHTYTQNGSYIVKATLSFSNGVADQHCQASVNINVQTPAYSCDKLNLTQGDNRNVNVTVKTSATGGATFDHAVVSWDDSSADTTTTNDGKAQHQYTADGTYNVAATAYFKVNDQLVPDAGNCTAQVTFTPQVCQYDSSLPANSPECVQPCQYDTTLPASSSECVPPTTPPEELPNTGAGDVIGLFLGASLIGGIGYRLALARRLSRQ